MATGRQLRVRQQLDAQATALTALPEKPLATVTAVTAAGSTDGIALVTVTYQGANLQLPYLTHYTPVVGHRVALDNWGGVLTIVGRPGGFPPNTGGA